MKIIPFLFILIFFGLFSCTRGNKTTEKKQQPNVVLICVDDMNGYGVNNEYPLTRTPNIDKLKSKGINFVNAACNSPVCNPSRSSFFSGLYPHTTGAYLNGSDGWNRSEILKTIKNIPEHFKANGYITWGAGKILHNPIDSAREAGMWDNYPVYQGGFGPFPEEEYWFGGNRFSSVKAWEKPDTDFPDVKNANAAIEFLGKDHDKPFLLYYGLWRPHTPYTAPKRFFDEFNEEDFALPESYLEGDLDDVPYLGTMLVDSLENFRNKPQDFETLWKKFLYGYTANTLFADWNVGRVIDALDNSKYAENTIVILWSDNGYHCGEKLRWQKATLWEMADKVPFIVRTPETKEAVSNATISLIDIYPTLVEYCGLTAPDHNLDGNSFAHMLTNPNNVWEHPSFTSYGVEYSSVRDERYRYIRYPDGQEELYDHNTDPFEHHNIANDASSKEIKERMSKHIPEKWAPSTGGRLEVPRNMEKVMRPATPFDHLKPNS